MFLDGNERMGDLKMDSGVKFEWVKGEKRGLGDSKRFVVLVSSLSREFIWMGILFFVLF